MPSCRKEPVSVISVRGGRVHAPTCKRAVLLPPGPKSSGPDVVVRKAPARVGAASVLGHFIPARDLTKPNGYAVGATTPVPWLRHLYRDEWGRHRHPLPMYWSWDEMFDLFNESHPDKPKPLAWNGRRGA